MYYNSGVYCNDLRDCEKPNHDYYDEVMIAKCKYFIIVSLEKR